MDRTVGLQRILLVADSHLDDSQTVVAASRMG